MRDDATDFTCGNCQAQPGQPCTQPTSTGRTPVTWFHYHRLLDALEAKEATA